MRAQQTREAVHDPLVKIQAKTQCVHPAATSDLEGDASHGQVLAVLQHAEVFRHQSGAVHQTLSRLGVVVPLRVLPRHVLQPREPQVRRRLVAFGDPAAKTDAGCDGEMLRESRRLARAGIPYLYMRSISISGSSWCSFILTVSERIMCRLNTRSWTWKRTEPSP